MLSYTPPIPSFFSLCAKLHRSRNGRLLQRNVIGPESGSKCESVPCYLPLVDSFGVGLSQGAGSPSQLKLLVPLLPRPRLTSSLANLTDVHFLRCLPSLLELQRLLKTHKSCRSGRNKCGYMVYKTSFLKVCIYGRFLNALNVFLSFLLPAHWAFGLFSI